MKIGDSSGSIGTSITSEPIYTWTSFPVSSSGTIHTSSKEDDILEDISFLKVQLDLYMKLVEEQKVVIASLEDRVKAIEETTLATINAILEAKK